MLAHLRELWADTAEPVEPVELSEVLRSNREARPALLRHVGEQLLRHGTGALTSNELLGLRCYRDCHQMSLIQKMRRNPCEISRYTGNVDLVLVGFERSTRQGQTALTWASEYGMEDILALLLRMAETDLQQAVSKSCHGESWPPWPNTKRQNFKKEFLSQGVSPPPKTLEKRFGGGTGGAERSVSVVSCCLERPCALRPAAAEGTGRCGRPNQQWQQVLAADVCGAMGTPGGQRILGMFWEASCDFWVTKSNCVIKLYIQFKFKLSNIF